MEHYAGPLETRMDLHGIQVYADAVDSLRAFESFHREHCGRRDQTPTPQARCLEMLEKAIALHAANGAPGSVQQLLPLLSLACWYREQLDHWLSAGAEEVESLAFLLGRAIILGMPAASLFDSHRTSGRRGSHDAFKTGQQQEMQEQQPTTNGALGDVALRKLQRDLALLPELAVELHVSPDEPPAPPPPSLHLNALDIRTVEDLRPFMPEDYVAPFSIDVPSSYQFLKDGGSFSSSMRKGNSRDMGSEGSVDQLEDCIQPNVGPVATWAENLRSFCMNSRSAIAADVCQTMRRWLQEAEGLPGPDGKPSKGALSVLARIAEWNTGRPKKPLLISELGIVLEPEQMRPGQRQARGWRNGSTRSSSLYPFVLSVAVVRLLFPARQQS